MIVYSLDADVLGYIQRAGQAGALTTLGALPVVIVDAVWDELTINAAANGAGRQSVEEAEAMMRAVAGAPTSIAPQSPESRTLAQLLAPPPSEGPGELSIIAHAIHHRDVVPVLLDRRALRRAVEELRRTVFSMHAFLDVLRADHGLAPSAAAKLSSYFCKRNNPVRPPLWW